MDLYSIVKQGKTNHGALIITEDGGENFKVQKLPFKLRQSDSIRFHPKRKDWIIGFETESVSLTSSGIKNVSIT